MAEVHETLERELAKSRESGFLTGETYEKARLEALRSAMESAKDAIKACILINGGAAGALLVFMGHLASVRDERLIRALAGSLRWFMIGLIAAIVAHWMAYASNLNFSRDPQQQTLKMWKIYRRLAIALIAFSVGFFGYGGYSAYRAFLATARVPPAPTLTIE